jgi:excisionase family DNA binding protein
MNSELLALSVADAVKVTGLGRSTIYSALRQGDLVARKVGRRTVIARGDLLRWLEALPPYDRGTTDDTRSSAT